MIFTNALSMLIIHHHLNGPGNKNLCSIQDVMRASEPASKRYKRVYKDFPNIVIFTKSAMPGEIQVMFGHMAIGNNSLGESVVAFALVGDRSSTSVISLKIEKNFSADSDKIRLPIAEVILCATTGNLTRSKKQWDWTLDNAVLLPPFITKAAILHGELDAGELLKIYNCSIKEWAKEGENTSEADDNNDKDIVITIKAEDKKS